MTCKPSCWAAPSPVLGNLPTFWAPAELAKDEGAADPRGIPTVACKRPGTESLDSEGSPGPISFLVSGIHRAGAKGIMGWWSQAHQSAVSGAMGRAEKDVGCTVRKPALRTAIGRQGRGGLTCGRHPPSPVPVKPRPSPAQVLALDFQKILLT